MRMRWAGHVAIKNWYKILIGNPQGKGLLARPRHRWEDNIKT
jgi:hypothetical protein